uniref:Uncharacterized protein n=1 Tax=Cajanus cajan TaxID=3821 RepID=A0A151U0I1_CAJCA|nr:hypothetical protein KK1_005373 [Cajanus cajan]
MSQTMCTKSKACPGIGADPPFPTSQNPNFATSTPAHAASAQPHQYVTPSAPQTGSARKHFAGHDDAVVLPHRPSEGSRSTPRSSRSAATTGRITHSAATTRNRGENLAMVGFGDRELRRLAAAESRTQQGKVLRFGKIGDRRV